MDAQDAYQQVLNDFTIRVEVHGKTMTITDPHLLVSITGPLRERKSQHPAVWKAFKHEWMRAWYKRRKETREEHRPASDGADPERIPPVVKYE